MMYGDVLFDKIIIWSDFKSYTNVCNFISGGVKSIVILDIPIIINNWTLLRRQVTRSPIDDYVG